MQAIVAIDIGTTGAKATLVGRDGKILASGYATYATQTAAGGIVEQNPDDWWRATCVALAQMWSESSHNAAIELAAVALSGQMQDMILLDDQRAVGPAILYSDSRAVAEAARLDTEIGGETLARITGNGQGASSVLAKWLWLQANDAERLQQCTTILLGAHDYIGWRLCGRLATDHTTASTTGLFDLGVKDWAHELLTQLGLDTSKLPALQTASELSGHVLPDAASDTGIPMGTPVYGGCGDLGATTVGVGAGLPGRDYCYLGTSGWIAASIEDATPQPERGIFTLRHPNPTRYIQVAPMLTAGGNLEWLRDLATGLNTKETDAIPYARLNQLAKQVPAGSRGLLYLPYLAGERSPFSDPNARAAFIGISAQTSTAELTRAVMEGVAMGYRTLQNALGLNATGPLLLAGGGGKSPVWSQIIADVLNRPVQIIADPGNAAARGAAVIAGKGMGWYDSYLPADDFFPSAALFTPHEANRNRYDDLFGAFQTLYPKLRATYAILARVNAVNS